ncbi:14205_t:CDS:2, partial [Cetraspora pellucida]
DIHHRKVPVSTFLHSINSYHTQQRQIDDYTNFYNQYATYQNLSKEHNEIMNNVSLYAIHELFNPELEHAMQKDYKIIRIMNNLFTVQYQDTEKPDSPIRDITLNSKSIATCTCFYLQSHRCPCRHIIAIYIKYFYQSVPVHEFHVRWHITDYEFELSSATLESISTMQVELKKLHNDALTKSLLETFVKMIHEVKSDGKLSNNLIDYLETYNVQCIPENLKISAPIIPQKRGRPSNNKYLKQKKEPVLQKNYMKNIIQKNSSKANSINIINDNIQLEKKFTLDSRIPLNMILAINDTISDGNCGFRAISLSNYQQKDWWLIVKQGMLTILNKYRIFYDECLGYDIKWLKLCLECKSSPCSLDYWFYMPDCTQIASDTFSRPIVIYGENREQSQLFLPYFVTASNTCTPIIIHWHNSNHYVQIEVNNNSHLIFPPIDIQYMHFHKDQPCGESWTQICGVRFRSGLNEVAFTLLEFTEKVLRNVTEIFDTLLRELLDDQQCVNIFEQMSKMYPLFQYTLFQEMINDMEDKMNEIVNIE